MKVVKTLDHVLENIAELERGRQAKGTPDEREYRNLIKRGTCFVPYKSDIGLAFAPSRFVGYVGNKLSSHASNATRDGRVTNSALKVVFGSLPIQDAIFEKCYIEFCKKLDVSASKSRTFGAPRKYWISSEVIELLETEAVAEIENNPSLATTEKQQLIKARIGQGLFREQLISYWKTCCVTSCTLLKVLRASHIKPWRQSSNKERLDVYNGLLLAPNADALFDQGLISFTDSGEMRVSPLITLNEVKTLLGQEKIKIATTPQHAKYLAYHRKHRFKAGVA